MARMAEFHENASACNCREGVILVYDGWGVVKRRPAPPVHDCEYIRVRNAVAHLAVRVADDSKAAWHTPPWREAYHRAIWSVIRTRLPKQQG